MPYNADGSFTMVNGATNAFAGQTIASATWNAINTDIQSALGHSGFRAFALRGVNFNQTSVDVAISITVPTARYNVNGLFITNASASLTAGAVGLFTATGGGGVVIIGSATLTVSATATDTANNLQIIISSLANTAYNDATLQFRLMASSGAPATADVILYLRPL